MSKKEEIYYQLEPVEELLYKEKGSKFIGYLYPVFSEENIRDKITEIKVLHPQATHHCYAYRIGEKGEFYRAHDDGEPKGTAGLPIYNQLQSFQLTNALLIVVRYFGGTKLGVSGLVTAYKASAELTLKGAEFKKFEKFTVLALSFPFSLQGKIQGLLNKYQTVILHNSFLTEVEMRIQLSEENSAHLINELLQYKSVYVKPIT